MQDSKKLFEMFLSDMKIFVSVCQTIHRSWSHISRAVKSVCQSLIKTIRSF